MELDREANKMPPCQMLYTLHSHLLPSPSRILLCPMSGQVFLIEFEGITQWVVSGRHSFRAFFFLPQTKSKSKIKGKTNQTKVDRLPTVPHAPFPGFQSAGSSRDIRLCIISNPVYQSIRDDRDQWDE